MRRVFKGLTSDSSSASKDVLSYYLDLVTFDEQLTQYECLIYSGFKDSYKLLHMPSQRYQWLVSANSPRLPLLLSGSIYLYYTLGLLYLKQKEIESYYHRQQILDSIFSCFWEVDIKSPLRAIGRLREVYISLLRETACIIAALTYRLKHWYQHTTTLSLPQREQLALREESELTAFFQICHMVSKLKRYHVGYMIPTIAFVKNAKLASLDCERLRVDGPLSEFITEKTRAAEDHLNTLGLTSGELIKLDQKNHSFWKGRRYQAHLAFIKLQQQRLEYRSHTFDFRSIWHIYEQLLSQVNTKKVKLNRIFHNKTYKLYLNFQDDLLLNQQQLAKKRLRNYLLQLDSNKHYLHETSEIKACLAVLPQHLQQSWNTIMEAIKQPDTVNLMMWDRAWKRLVHGLEIEVSEEEQVLNRVVSNYLIPSVTNTAQPAYDLIYRMDKAAAHHILQPTFNDIIEYLQDDVAWENYDIALEHFLFLLGVMEDKSEVYIGYLDKIIEQFVFASLFTNVISLSILNKLKKIVVDLNGSKFSRCWISDLITWHEKTTSIKSLPILIEEQMQADMVLKLSASEWMIRVASLARLMDLLKLALEDKMHPYHTASQSLYNRISQQLLVLLKSAGVIKTEQLRIIVFFCVEHSMTEDTCREGLREQLQYWNTTKRVSQKSIKSVERTSLQAQPSENHGVFIMLFNSVQKMLSQLIVLSKDKSGENKQMEKLPDLNLNRRSLELLIHYKDIDPQVRRHIIRWLTAISTSCFVTKRGQRQTNLLLNILSESTIEPEKESFISQYMDLMSHRSHGVLALVNTRLCRMCSQDLVLNNRVGVQKC